MSFIHKTPHHMTPDKFDKFIHQLTGIILKIIVVALKNVTVQKQENY